jgi:hypothetical protein
MKTNSRFLFAAFAALTIAILAIGVSAQEYRGTISGTVTDPNGSVVPGARVAVKNVATNIAVNVVTNDSGSYTVPFLVPGSYNVSIVGEGFKTSTRENVQVSVDDRLTLDFQLEIGTAAEVNIVADADLIERGSVTTGSVISRRQVEELPLAEGAPYVLATQAPGVVYTGDPNFTGPTANGNLAGFRTNGTAGNQINLDGTPNLAYSGQVAFTPPSDAVQEFKVQTNSFDSQNGFTAGSTVNVALKTGTNEFHGSAYLYNRDKSRTANNFFNNRSGRERPDRKYNRYGTTVTGPIIKNKTFFLGSFERQFDNVAQPTTYSVPTLKMRNGDFTELLGDLTNVASTANTIIYDPQAGTAANATRPSFGCPTSGPIPAGSQCNIIPLNRIYGPALAFLKLFPEPNQPGLIVNNYITDQNLQRPYRAFLGKVDHNLNANHKISFTWANSKNTEDRYNLTLEPDSIFRGFEDRRNDRAHANYTGILRPNFILDVRGGWNRFKLSRYQVDQPTAADLGFTAVPTERQNLIFPRFDFQNYMTLGSQRADYNNGQDRQFDLATIQPTVTQIFGNHTLKYGYDYRNLRERFTSLGNATGRYSINGQFTSSSSATAGGSASQQTAPGREIASFLLGIVTGGSIDIPTIYDASEDYHGFFAQDDWRITPNITLNLGLRYELETGVLEGRGAIAKGFDRTAKSPIADQVLTNYNLLPPLNVPIGAFQNLVGGLTFVTDDDDYSQAMDKNNFQPRVGISWGINQKTVLRGGFGIFTQPFQIGSIFQPGFASSTPFTASTNNGQTYLATLRTSLFPTGINPPVGSTLGLSTFLGGDLAGTNGAQGPTTPVLSYDRKNSNFYRFMASIQRELPGGIGVEFTFMHSAGRDLPVFKDLNPVPVSYLVNPASYSDAASLTAAINTASAFLSGTVSNPFRGMTTAFPGNTAFTANTIARRRLLTPFPQFAALSVTEYNGTSSYQSYAVQVQKRFTEGLSLNGSYTRSKERITAQYLNPQDMEMTEMISPFERPHRFTFSGIYELPFGSKRRWGSDWNRVVDGILGGWQIQGVYEWQSGEPLLLPNVYYNGDITKLKSRIGEYNEQGQKYGIDIPAFDITGFYIGGVVANANAPSFGNNFQTNTASGSNVLRNIPFTTDNLRNQRFLKFDVGVSKNFRIREGMKFQVRFEAINALNSTYFGTGLGVAPGTSTAFGKVTSQRNPPRDIQIGGRFTF